MSAYPICLNQLTEHAAERTPDQVAFRCGEEQLTHAEFCSKSNQLARVLLDLRLEHGERVGILLPRRLQSAVAVHGILRAGGAYVPIDPRLPVARMADVARDCALRILVTAPQMDITLNELLRVNTPIRHVVGSGELPTQSVSVLSWEAVDSADTSAVPVGCGPGDLAYIMYTSGSTGIPKGLMHTHFSGMSYARLVSRTYGLHDRDRLVMHAPLHFDMSLLGLMAGPLVGATTVIIPDELLLFPSALACLVSEERITVWYSVPWALLQLLRAGQLEAYPAPDLRWVLYAGEAFPTSSLRELMKKWPQALVSNVYGPAEVNQCTYHHLESPPEYDTPVPIGTIWKETQGLVVDEQDAPVPRGEPGELLIHSSTMMEGYWNRPDLNREAFFHQHNENGTTVAYYRTGDTVHEDADGLLHFHGRRDRQIKTRGFRVELDEVEAALSGLPAVVEAATFAIDTGGGSSIIGAAVIAESGREVNAGHLRVELSALLPHYALPENILLSRRFPQTGSGKTDRKGLASLYLDTFHAD